MELEITPHPTDEERAAIAKALAQEAEEHPASPWAVNALPGRETEEA